MAAFRLSTMGLLALMAVFARKEDGQPTGPSETRPKVPAAASPQEQARGSSRDKAVAWLRANNAFGPKHRMVDQLAKALDEVDGGKAFFLRLGTRLVKSRKPTLLAGRNGAFRAFEVPPDLAGKWIPELLTEFKTTAALDEVVEPVPVVILDNLKFDNASGLDARGNLTGTVGFQKGKLVDGIVGLRLTFMAGEYTHTRYQRFARGVFGDKGTLAFSFPPLRVTTSKLSGFVPVFVELCAFRSPDERGKVVVLSNSIPGLVNVVEHPGATEEK